MVAYEFASQSQEVRYRLDLGFRQLRTDIAANAIYGIVMFVATIKVQLHDRDVSSSQLLCLWALQVRSIAQPRP